MKSKSSKSASTSSSRSGEARLSNVCKPSGMTMTEWQVKLREQAARKEVLGVSKVDVRNEPGAYQVVNLQSRGKYRVLYYGRGWPSSEQLFLYGFQDFAIGTCKHLEAVRMKVYGKRERMLSPLFSQRL